MSQYLHVLPEHKTIAHHQNILDIWTELEKTHELDGLRDLEPIIAGGLPTAMMAAPRTLFNKSVLQAQYWHDIDIYASDQVHEELLTEWLVAYAKRKGYKAIQTDNAVGLDYRYIKCLPIQIVTAYHSHNAEEILASFDLVNCAAAFQPKSGKITLHKDFIPAHLEKKVHFLNPRSLSDPEAANVLHQLLRLYKYCKRYDATLSDETLRRLLELREQNARLTIPDQAVVRYNSLLTAHLDAQVEDVWALIPLLVKDYEALPPEMISALQWTNSLELEENLKRLSDNLERRTTPAKNVLYNPTRFSEQLW